MAFMGNPIIKKVIIMKRILLLLVSFFSIGLGFGQITTIDFEALGVGYTPSATEGSGFTDVFNRSN